ncbi:unnamed protein product [Schistosoma mansoni]|uniref:Smp_205580 n=1 Tax=Schistosoma mansoni TaxID=6183 RepID=UPI00022C8534|nr:unnamed protein product [Schistosoma mansoni]|eukprot:XP_018647444.1 unnamed protein product [Schistosoma mansoni]
MSVMCKSFLFSLFILSIFITKMEFSGSGCKQKGESCAKTIFDRCCGELVCELDAPFSGKCVECLSFKSFCMSNKECCSKKCHLSTCKL